MQGTWNFLGSENRSQGLAGPAGSFLRAHPRVCCLATSLWSGGPARSWSLSCRQAHLRGTWDGPVGLEKMNRPRSPELPHHVQEARRGARTGTPGSPSWWNTPVLKGASGGPQGQLCQQHWVDGPQQLPEPTTAPAGVRTTGQADRASASLWWEESVCHLCRRRSRRGGSAPPPSCSPWDLL